MYQIPCIYLIQYISLNYLFPITKHDELMNFVHDRKTYNSYSVFNRLGNRHIHKETKIHKRMTVLDRQSFM